MTLPSLLHAHQSKMAVLGGWVNAIICHANQRHEQVRSLDVMSLLVDMTAANSPVSPPHGVLPKPSGLFDQHADSLNSTSE